MTARTAYGLEAPRVSHWAERAACNRINNRAVDPEWFWPVEHGAPSTTTRLAAHICWSHCPVRVACHQAAVENPPQHPVIQGGRRYVVKSQYRAAVSPDPVPMSAVGCPYCAQEATC